MKPTTLIEPADLQARLGEVLVVDCRARLGEPNWGQAAYAEGHIDTALYANLDTDLALPPDERGRHPLPSMDSWVDTLCAWGVTHERPVVVYDDALGAYAARAWWMLRWAGHAHVSLLNGGLAAWQAADLPLTTQSPELHASSFAARAALVKLCNVDSVAEISASQESNVALLDARAEARWAGRAEPIDPVAGHIPGAVCFDFQGNCEANGRFKSIEALQSRFASVLDQPVVCYCGSGVTAAHNVLALTLAGHQDISLYADSWSGWITDPQRPIARSGD